MRLTALDQAVAPDDEHDGTQADGRDIADVGELLTGRGESVLTLELQGEYSEQNGCDELPNQLRGLVQSEVALLADLDEIVEKPDEPQHRGQPEHEESRRRWTVRVVADADEVRAPVAGPQAGEYGDAAHGRGAAFRLVTGRALDSDLLAEALLRERFDQHRRQQNRDCERNTSSEEDLSHCDSSGVMMSFSPSAAVFCTSASATDHSATD